MSRSLLRALYMLAVGMAACSGDSHPGGHAPMSGEVEQIQFVRSGGFAALGRPLDGEVVIQGQDGTASSQFSGAQRKLNAADLKMLQALSVADLRRAQSSAQLSAGGAPDRYQYDVTIKPHSGEPVHLTLHEQQSTDELNRISPGLGDLKAWIAAESQAIWKQKAASRSP